MNEDVFNDPAYDRYVQHPYMRCWQIWVDGHHVDTVLYCPDMDADYVRRSEAVYYDGDVRAVEEN